MASDALLAAVANVDVMDAAGRIIAHPRRHAPSATTAEVYAIAVAFERSWEVALEAELLVRALDLPDATAEEAAIRDHAVAVQKSTLKSLMSAIRGGETEGATA